MTGHLKSTPVETLRQEAGICSIATASKRATALAYETILEGKSWQCHPVTAFNDQAGELLHRLQPGTYQRSRLTWLTLTPLSPALGKTQATGVYTPTTWHLRPPKRTPPLPVIHQTPECPIHHLHRWFGNSGDTKWWRGNGGIRRGPGQLHDSPHEVTAQSRFHLIIRRRESGHAHGALVAPAIACSRSHLHRQPITY